MPSQFVRRFVAAALSQYDAYRYDSEADPPLARQIETYWQTLGLAFPGVSTAWSAVFVSWCAKTAGATAEEFPFAIAHSRFIHAFIANAAAERGVFRAHPIDRYAPKVGDIVHNNRGGASYDYAFAATHSRYASHTAVVVREGVDARGRRYVETIGGNESDSVGLKRIKLSANGLIVQRGINPYIAVVETLK